jgi:hypothetical protein
MNAVGRPVKSYFIVCSSFLHRLRERQKAMDICAVRANRPQNWVSDHSTLETDLSRPTTAETSLDLEFRLVRDRFISILFYVCLSACTFNFGTSVIKAFFILAQYDHC